MGFKIRVQTLDEEAQTLKLNLSTQLILQDQVDVQAIVSYGEPVTYTAVIGGEFNTATFDGVRLVGYIMQDMSSVVSSSSCTFNIFSVNQPNWVETLLYSAAGTLQPNNYWFVSLTEAQINTLLDGDPTLMVEVAINRLGKTIKNRIYLNQLGIFDSFFKTKRALTIMQATEKTQRLK